MEVHIGTSGWSYDHWQGIAYPVMTPTRERLRYYTEHFRTVEVNSTFYHWPRQSTFEGWYNQLPEGFVFTVKAPRGLTHGARLYAPEKWLGIVERGLSALREKRGILLVQLPPDLDYDYARLEYFLERLPGWFQVAIEFRHEGWNRDCIFSLLERHGVAYCVMSGARLPCVLRVTAPFVYVRMHGPSTDHLYGGSYSDADLTWWKHRIEEWTGSGREVYVYFNNDGGGNAVRNAHTLSDLVGI